EVKEFYLRTQLLSEIPLIWAEASIFAKIRSYGSLHYQHRYIHSCSSDCIQKRFSAASECGLRCKKSVAAHFAECDRYPCFWASATALLSSARNTPSRTDYFTMAFAWRLGPSHLMFRLFHC